MSTLSVVMFNYNDGPYIHDAIADVLNQTRRPDKLIILDDGSTDNSVNLIQLHESDPIVDFRPFPHRGLMATAQELTPDLVDTDYVYLVASNDVRFPQFIERSMAALERYPQAGLCCSNPIHFDGIAPTRVYRDNKLPLAAGFMSPRMVISEMSRTLFPIAGHTAILRTDTFFEAGRYRPELKWHCDWFVSLVIAFRHGIVVLPENLAAMRCLPRSYSSNALKNESEENIILNRILDLLETPEYRDVADKFRKSGAIRWAETTEDVLA